MGGAEKKGFAAYVELTKPRILTMVLVTAVLGYVLALRSLSPLPLLLWTLLGTGLASGGAGALNHYIERDVDAKMARTQRRPLITGAVKPQVALLLGSLMLFAGGAILAWQVNYLASALALTSALLYVLIYTPLKRISWLNTSFGAIPGAIPPMIGWAAARNELGLPAWVLFFILFLWQHPHFYAIAWMFREDYRAGGFKMLPVVQPSGKSTFRHSLAACIVLIPVSLWPTFVQMTGWIYFGGALLMGLWFLAACVRWRMSESTEDARRVLRVSIMYLPALLLLILVDSLLLFAPPTGLP